MRVSATAAGDPLFGVELNDISYPGDTLQQFGTIGSATVDAANGEVVYSQGGTGFLVGSSDIVSLNTWHHFLIEADFQDQSYQVLVDGTLVATQPFAATDFYTGGNLTQFSDASLVSYNSFTSNSLTGNAGTGFYDNYLIQTSNKSMVPEPEFAAMIPMLFGATALLRFSRRRSRHETVAFS
jgi:hypothetical protein